MPKQCKILRPFSPHFLILMMMFSDRPRGFCDIKNDVVIKMQSQTLTNICSQCLLLSLIRKIFIVTFLSIVILIG